MSEQQARLTAIIEVDMSKAFQEMAAFADTLAKSMSQVGDAIAALAEALKVEGRRWYARRYGRRPVLRAIRGMAYRMGLSMWHPLVWGYWIRTQYDQLPREWR